MANVLGYVFNVMRYGAKGDGSTNDKPAIDAAIAAARAAGGGTVFFPRPSVCYRVTGQILVGQRWVDERYVTYAYDLDVTATTGYDATKRTNVESEPVVHLEGEPGAEIWGDFSPSNETAILYFGAGGSTNRGTRNVIRNLSIVGQAGYSGGAPVFPGQTTAVATKQIGLFMAAASRVKVDHCRFRELNRGLVSYASYWSRIVANEVVHANRGMELLEHNAATATDNYVNGILGYGFLVTGQGTRLRNNDTEEAITDYWIPSCDQLSIDGGYLESLGSTWDGYHIRWGDTDNPSTTQCVQAEISNLHGSRDYGAHMDLVATQLRAKNVRWYSVAHGDSYTTMDADSYLFRDNPAGTPIDPAWVAAHSNFGVVDGGQMLINGGLRLVQGQYDSSNTGLAGLSMGRGSVWVDPTTVEMGFSADNGSFPRLKIALNTGKLIEEGGHACKIEAKGNGATLTDYDQVVVIDASAGNVTITLPTLSGLHSGEEYVFKRIDGSGNSVTIQRGASDTIDGATSLSLAAQYATARIVAYPAASIWLKV